MRRTTYILALCLALAVVVLALVNEIGSDHSSNRIEPTRGEAKGARQASAVQRSQSGRTDVDPRESSAGDLSETLTEAHADSDLVDEATSRKLIRDRATRNIRRQYSLLIEKLGLTAQKKEALISLLIESRIAGTRTPHAPGRALNADEQSSRIAAIIGYPKLTEFRTLERNLSAYSEVQTVVSLLQANGVPLADLQRDKLFDILVQTRELPKTARSDAERGSIEFIEQRLNTRNEYERHVLELAGSVLSSKQLQHLFELYEHQSMKRAATVEAMKKRRTERPDERFLWYPASY